MSELIQHLEIGFGVALSAQALIYCAAGVSIGMFIGVLPGIGVLATLSILLPLTYHLDPTTALIALAGIYYGAAYGGSTAAILLNIPGTANTAVTCLDGFPMARQGRASVALFITTIASFIGSVVGILLLATFAIPLANTALEFAPADYFSLMVLGLLAASLVASGSIFRSLSSVFIGLLFGVVGTDINTGVLRFTFENIYLFDGLSLVALAVGFFGIPEVIESTGRIAGEPKRIEKVTWKAMLPSAVDWRRSLGAMFRGTSIGAIFGALPGAGGTMASFVSYAVEKRIHKRPEEFGKGAIEGVSGPEAANNAAIQTAFIPTLTLGVPGDAVMALVLAILMIHGVAPGPSIISANPELFWGLIASFLIGNVMLLVLNLPLIQIWVRVLSVPTTVLIPSIVVFASFGVYSARYAEFDIYMMAAFGLIGFFMRVGRFDAAPLLLGFVLGPMLEEYFRRALLLSRGDLLVFVWSPVSATLLMIALAILIFVTVRSLYLRYVRPY